MINRENNHFWRWGRSISHSLKCVKWYALFSVVRQKWFETVRKYSVITECVHHILMRLMIPWVLPNVIIQYIVSQWQNKQKYQTYDRNMCDYWRGLKRSYGKRKRNRNYLRFTKRKSSNAISTEWKIRQVIHRWGVIRIRMNV